MKKLTRTDIISLKTNLLGELFNFRVTLLLVLTFAVNCHFFPCALWKENVDLYIYFLLCYNFKDFLCGLILHIKFVNIPGIRVEHKFCFQNFCILLLFLTVQRSFIFSHPLCRESRGNGLQQLALPLALAVGFSGWSRPALPLSPRTFLFGFLLFLIIFFHMFQEAVWALRVLTLLSV